jgi:casein kinase II subunit beta
MNSGNHVLCEVDKPFIEDSFNLFGIKQFIPGDFNRAMAAIVDKDGKRFCRKILGVGSDWWILFTAVDEVETEEEQQASALLYGLIHARFIITNNGLQAMVSSGRRLRCFTPYRFCVL